MTTRAFRLNNVSENVEIANRVRFADSFLKRLRGLLLSEPLKAGEGLYLTPCNCIHMIGMAYAIDCIFVDSSLKVVALIEAIKPWHLSPEIKPARGVIELLSGTIATTKIKVGDQLEFLASPATN